VETGRDGRDSRDSPGPATIVVVTVDELREVVRDEVRRALAERPSQPVDALVSDWIGDDEAARMLGMAKSYLRKVRDLPVHKVGRKRRYRRSEVDAFISKRAG
jgi:excisionase family DNA binding protein